MLSGKTLIVIAASFTLAACSPSAPHHAAPVIHSGIGTALHTAVPSPTGGIGTALCTPYAACHNTGDPTR